MKLEARRGPVEVLVIDHIDHTPKEKPRQVLVRDLAIKSNKASVLPP